MTGFSSVISSIPKAGCNHKADREKVSPKRGYEAEGAEVYFLGPHGDTWDRVFSGAPHNFLGSVPRGHPTPFSNIPEHMAASSVLSLSSALATAPAASGLPRAERGSQARATEMTGTMWPKALNPQALSPGDSRVLFLLQESKSRWNCLGTAVPWAGSLNLLASSAPKATSLAQEQLPFLPSPMLQDPFSSYHPTCRLVLASTRMAADLNRT